MNIRDRTILLTGATGGIGRHLALVFAQAGARLILVGRNAQQLESLKNELTKAHLPHLCVVADLLTEQGRKLVVDSCIQHPIDILVNNAGVSEFELLEDTAEAAISAQLTLNLQVPILLTQQLLPQLQQRARSAIVNVGSTFGSIGYPGFSIYSASKFGLRGFTEALRRELADSSIGVLYVAPRATLTNLNSPNVVAMNRALGNTMDDPARVAAFILQRILTGRWGSAAIGWPERLYTFINSVLPSLTDRTLRRQLPAIRQFAGADVEQVTPVLLHSSISQSIGEKS